MSERTNPVLLFTEDYDKMSVYLMPYEGKGYMPHEHAMPDGTVYVRESGSSEVSVPIYRKRQLQTKEPA